MELKRFVLAGVLLSGVFSGSLVAKESTLYLNSKIGFDVDGFSYSQEAYPCDVDQQLTDFVVKKAAQRGIDIEAVDTPDKIFDQSKPLLAIDIQQLVLTPDVQYGPKSNQVLPKIMLKTALNKYGDVQLETHQCAIATLSEFTSSSDILDMGTVATVCSAVRRCARNVSSDVVDWLEKSLNTK